MPGATVEEAHSNMVSINTMHVVTDKQTGGFIYHWKKTNFAMFVC